MYKKYNLSQVRSRQAAKLPAVQPIVMWTPALGRLQVKKMIKEVNKSDVSECVKVIRSSFMTIAEQFGFTIENAPRFTAFATTEERLLYQLDNEPRYMFAYSNSDGKIIGYYSLLMQGKRECELNNLCVLPEYRHRKIGQKLLKDAYSQAEAHCKFRYK